MVSDLRPGPVPHCLVLLVAVLPPGIVRPRLEQPLRSCGRLLLTISTAMSQAWSDGHHWGFVRASLVRRLSSHSRGLISNLPSWLQPGASLLVLTRQHL